MDIIVTFVLFVGFIFLFVQGIMLANKYGWLKLENVLLLVILAFIYEMLILFIGKWVGEGNLLKILNYVRYWLHALITPLLILVLWKLLYRANVVWSKKIWVKLLVCLLTIGLIFYELVTGVFGIKLEKKWENGILMYENIRDMGVPVMVIILSIFILMTSLILWRKQKWPWLFFGILIMIVGSMITNSLNQTTLTNVFEWILMYSFLVTKKFQDRHNNIS